MGETKDTLKQEARWAKVCIGFLITTLACWATAAFLVTAAVTKARGQGIEYMARPHTAVIVDVKKEKVYRNPQAIYEDRDACENAIDGIGPWLDQVAKMNPNLAQDVTIPYPKGADRKLLEAVADLVVTLLDRDNAMPTLTISCAPVGRSA